MRANELCLADQTFKAEHHIACAEIRDGTNQLLDAIVLDDRHEMADLRIAGATVAKQFHRIHGFKCIGLQVDDVYALRRVLEHLFDGDVHPEVGLSGRDQHGVVVADPVDRARSQSRHEAHQSVTATDAGGPAKLVVAERHAGAGRKKVLADLLAHDLLDHDAHLFMNIQQSAFRAVLGWVGSEDGGINFGDGVHQGGQPVFLGCPGCRGRGSCTFPKMPIRRGLRADSSCERSADGRRVHRVPATVPSPAPTETMSS